MLHTLSAEFISERVSHVPVTKHVLALTASRYGEDIRARPTACAAEAGTAAASMAVAGVGDSGSESARRGEETKRLFGTAEPNARDTATTGVSPARCHSSPASFHFNSLLAAGSCRVFGASSPVRLPAGLGHYLPWTLLPISTGRLFYACQYMTVTIHWHGR
jgi:hypothetical protein